MLLTRVASRCHACGMRPFNPEYKVHADSLVEIREAFDDAVKILARGAIRWGRVRIKKVQVLNALILWFLRQPEAVQRDIIGEAMPVLRKHAEAASPQPIEPASVPAAVGRKRGFAAGHTVVDSDSHRENRIAGDTRLPKRGG